MYEALQGLSATSLAEGIPLCQVSTRDSVWDTHRFQADVVEHLYRDTDFSRYSERIRDCSQVLFFKYNVSGGLTLSACHFCRVRYCPICQWRRSAMWKAKAHQALPKVLSDYPGYHWIFLTLTVRNCPIEQLRDTVKSMNKGFKRLTELKAFPGKGWIKSLEVTRSRDGSAHPHFHCLLLVLPSYYSGVNYISKVAWNDMWKQSAKLSYDPITHVKKIDDNGLVRAIPEILKYQTKESDLVAEQSWLLELTRQLHKTRAVSVGGVLRDYFRELEEDPEDLIGEGKDETISDFLLGFRWRKRLKQYRSFDNAG